MINVGAVIQSYQNAQKAAETAASGEDTGFAELVNQALTEGMGNLKNAEKISTANLKGKANINDVIAATNAADASLQTIIAIRDKLVAAYQELLRSGM